MFETSFSKINPEQKSSKKFPKNFEIQTLKKMKTTNSYFLLLIGSWMPVKYSVYFINTYLKSCLLSWGCTFISPFKM